MTTPIRSRFITRPHGDLRKPRSSSKVMATDGTTYDAAGKIRKRPQTDRCHEEDAQ